ncbi:MAG: hypothetical protein K6E57_00560 [Fibrobacter sp.]|nr:hypothetical protein [Fibrobacter sp.]
MMKRIHITAFLIVVTILAVAFFVRDWYVFYQCGAVEQCLVDSSHFQNYAKFAVTAIMTIVALFIGKDALCKRDRRFLQLGFVFALCADFCLKILHNVASLFEHSGDYTLLGICFFMVVQALFIYRHTRESDDDKHTPGIIVVPFVVMFICNALHLFGVFGGPTIPTVATYGAFLICSLIVAWQAPKKGYFPAKNARNIKRGMILFFCCDACVGISLATGADHSLQEIVATVANNFVWYFYTPALILLALSGYRRDR